MSNATEYDSPLKEAWRIYLRSFLRICFPKVERAIDWSRRPEFLDKELQKIVPQAESGKQFVDLLIKVWLRDGSEEWILLHVEIQHRPEPGFEVRLYRYNYRAMDVYGRPVITLAVLADTDPDWRPTHYELVLPGTRVRVDFSVCKLLDLTADEAALRASREPAAVVILANWAAQQTGQDAERRRVLKWELTRRLYDMGLGKADIRELYRLVDWLVRLPDDLEAQFHEKLYEFENERNMPYVTSAERFGIEKGLQQGIEKGLQQGIEKGLQQGIEKGLQQGIEKGLQQGIEKGQILAGQEAVVELLRVRFGSVPKKVRERVKAERNSDRLRRWHRLAATCTRLEDLHLG